MLRLLHCTLLSWTLVQQLLFADIILVMNYFLSFFGGWRGGVDVKTNTGPLDIFPEGWSSFGSEVTKILKYRQTDSETDRRTDR